MGFNLDLFPSLSFDVYGRLSAVLLFHFRTTALLICTDFLRLAEECFDFSRFGWRRNFCFLHRSVFLFLRRVIFSSAKWREVRFDPPETSRHFYAPTHGVLIQPFPAPCPCPRFSPELFIGERFFATK